jgi:hypothetical protein
MFMSTVEFERAYPTVETITVAYKQEGYMLHDHQKRSGTYTKETLVPSMSCSNVSCKQGGFLIEFEIREMVRNKQTTRKTAIGCSGHEGSEKGRRRGRDCMNHLELNISITYKGEGEASQ